MDWVPHGLGPPWILTSTFPRDQTVLGLQRPKHTVDLGSHQLKVVNSRYLRKNTFQVANYKLFDAPDEPLFPLNTKADLDLSGPHVDAISRAIKGAGIRRQYVQILFPDFAFQTFTLPISEKVSEEEKLNAINQEIATYLPDEAERPEWIIERKELGKLHTNTLTFMAMIKQRHVLEVGEFFQSRGAYPTVVDISLLNAINVFHDYLTDPDNRERNIGILYFGHQASSLAIYKDGLLTTLHVRGISSEGPQEPLLGGRAFTKRILEHFKFTQTQAESYKREEVFFLPEFVPEQDKITNYQVIKPVFGDLVRGLFGLTEHYVATFREFKVDEIIMTGGGANFSNIDVVLGGHLNIQIRKGSEIVSILDASGNELPDDVKNVLTPAIGMCIREEGA